MNPSPTQKNLIVFGYGVAFLSALPSVGAWLKHVVHAPHWVVLVVFVAALVALSWKDMSGRVIVPISWIIVTVAGFQGVLGIFHAVLAMLSVTFFAMTVLEPQTLSGFYARWMQVAHKFGQLVTLVILGTVFYAVFTPVAFLLKMLKKDYMHRRLDSSAASYWHKRPEEQLSKQRYTQQF